MLEGWIQTGELGLIVEHFFLVIIDDLIEVLFHIDDVDEVTMLIELLPLHLQLQNVMM